MPTFYGRRKNKDFASFAEAQKNILAEIDAFIDEQRPTFKRMVILDVISDPQKIDSNRITYWQDVLGVSNTQYVSYLPRNAVVAQFVLDGIKSVSSPMFAFPFFPSHLALPCKPGEIVWSMVENPGAGIKDMAWWICKVQGLNFVDDTNHSHFPNSLNPSFIPGLSKKFLGTNEDKPLYRMYNGKIFIDNDGKPRFVPKSQIIPGTKDDVFEQLVTKTEASKMMQYESIPRFRKRPGDIALEGSNNTLIVLGTDRTKAIADYSGMGRPYQYPEINEKNEPTPEFNNFPKWPVDDYFGKAGSIDLVAGRGTLPETGGQSVATKRALEGEVDSEGFKKELGKYETELSPQEGDPDLINDRSRVLISQRTAVDKNFGLAAYQERFNIQDNSWNSAVVIKSDKVRIIARSDISLIVTDNDPTPRYDASSGDTSEFFAKDNIDQKRWASITIKANGDIVFTPSEKGYIKLGDDTADKAILCTDITLDPDGMGGEVKAAPIFTTGNKQVGTGKAGQGTFAKKVLVK